MSIEDCNREIERSGALERLSAKWAQIYAVEGFVQGFELIMIRLMQATNDMIVFTNEDLTLLFNVFPPVYRKFLELDIWSDTKTVLDIQHKHGFVTQAEIDLLKSVGELFTFLYDMSQSPQPDTDVDAYISRLEAKMAQILDNNDFGKSLNFTIIRDSTLDVHDTTAPKLPTASDQLTTNKLRTDSIRTDSSADINTTGRASSHNKRARRLFEETPPAQAPPTKKRQIRDR